MMKMFAKVMFTSIVTLLFATESQAQSCACSGASSARHKLVVDSPATVVRNVVLGTSDFFGGQLVACFTNEFGERELAFLYDEQAGYLTALAATSFFCTGQSAVSYSAFVGSGSRACASAMPWDSIQSFEYNGHRLEFVGTDAPEQFSTDSDDGGADSYCSYFVRNSACGLGGEDQIRRMLTAYGGPGNDVLVADCPGTHLYGGDGHDHLTNAFDPYNKRTQIFLFGEGGKDCLAPYALSTSSFSCGSGTDFLYASGVTSRPSNCENFSWSRACATSSRDWWGW